MQIFYFHFIMQFANIHVINLNICLNALAFLVFLFFVFFVFFTVFVFLGVFIGVGVLG